jgi:hypothetical protein
MKKKGRRKEQRYRKRKNYVKKLELRKKDGEIERKRKGVEQIFKEKRKKIKRRNRENTGKGRNKMNAGKKKGRKRDRITE